MEKALDIEFMQVMCHPDTIKEIFDCKHHIICLDDSQHEGENSKEAEKVFTRLSHKNLSVIYLNQTLYYQGKCAHTLNLNTDYTVLLTNPKNTQQVALLGRQLGMGAVLKEPHRDTTSKPFGYLVAALSPKSNEKYRL